MAVHTTAGKRGCAALVRGLAYLEATEIMGARKDDGFYLIRARGLGFDHDVRLRLIRFVLDHTLASPPRPQPPVVLLVGLRAATSDNLPSRYVERAAASRHSVSSDAGSPGSTDASRLAKDWECLNRNG